MTVFTVVGVICVAAWSYVALAVLTYRLMSRYSYPYERWRLAAVWPIAAQILIIRYVVRRRRAARFPKAKVHR